jgi:hypothetical protein
MVWPNMNDQQFTVQAATLWGTIPRKAREQILKNVFCVKCRGAAEMINFTGEVRDDDLVLTGACAKCGHEVVRVLETSEVDSSGN